MSLRGAAAIIGMTEQIGALPPGMVAAVSVLADERGAWALRDNSGERIVADRYLRPLFCLRAGARHEADAVILPGLEAAA